jgi:hypothetical protein
VPYEIDFLPVGDSNGDAICLRYGTDQGFDIHVVDGAFAPTAQTIIDHITKYYTADPYIANVVLSHADDDHAPGLIGVLERFKVGTLWINCPWLHAQAVIDNFHGNWTLEGLVKEMRDRHPYLIDLERVAARRGVTVRDVFQGDQIGPFTVLAPSRDRYIRLIPDLTKTPQSYAEAKRPSGAFGQAAKDLLDRVGEYWNVETLDASPPPTSASNETSVVQLGVIDGEKFLLTADVGPEGLLEAAEYARSRGLLGPRFRSSAPSWKPQKRYASSSEHLARNPCRKRERETWRRLLFCWQGRRYLSEKKGQKRLYAERLPCACHTARS